MYYAIAEQGRFDTLHVFENRDERDDFAREHEIFVCTSKEARRLLEHEVLYKSDIPTSDVRALTMDDLVNALLDCDYVCRMHDNGLVELSNVTLHWEV